MSHSHVQSRQAVKTSDTVAIPFDRGDNDKWDRFISDSNSGNLLQTRRFLDYHDDRFQDQSAVFVHKQTGKWAGVMPAATSIDEDKLVVSHPGSTFGGIITNAVDPKNTLDCMVSALRLYQELGFERLLLKTLPSAFMVQPDDSLMQLCWRYGELVRNDLWNLINLKQPWQIHSKRRNTIRKGQKSGII